MAIRHDVVSHPFTIDFIRIKARQLCRRTDVSRSDSDDLKQAMLLYLLEKAHMFDPTRGNIEAFVTQLIKTWVAMELRHRGRIKRKPTQRNVSLDMIESDGSQIPLSAALNEADLLRRLGRTPESEIHRLEVREAIDHAIKQLTPDQQRLLADFREVGVERAGLRHGISPSTVRRHLSQLRQTFSKAGLGPDER